MDEQPHPFFTHFCGNDDAIKLAKGLRAAPPDGQCQVPHHR
jgi:hypothetical protein